LEQLHEHAAELKVQQDQHVLALPGRGDQGVERRPLREAAGRQRVPPRELLADRGRGVGPVRHLHALDAPHPREHLLLRERVVNRLLGPVALDREQGRVV